MADITGIGWTDHTFNVWWGCARVSPACRSCYADTTAQRWGKKLWRRHGRRQMMSDAYWRNPARWNRAAQAAGRPAKVFCASMADVFERHPEPDVNAQLDAARARLWQVIAGTPWLRWQLLTKRPENVPAMVPWAPGEWPAIVWLGTSVETQRFAEQRIPHLIAAGAQTTFLSCEPLLEQVDLSPWLTRPAPISWVIAGGESGPRSRRTDLAWFGALRDQCLGAGVAYFVKQTGTVAARELGVRGKGEDLADLPADLRIRQYPKEPAA